MLFLIAKKILETLHIEKQEILRGLDRVRECTLFSQIITEKFD